MKIIFLLAVGLFAATAFAQTASWECRNDLEVRCAGGKCEAESGDGFTPMSVTFAETGRLSVCAYTGCWEGTAGVSGDDRFLMLTGRGLRFSTNASMKEDIAVVLDRRDGVATLKAGGFAHPLICKKGGRSAGEPDFGDHRVEVSTAAPKPIRFEGNRDARMFRTRLREAWRGGVNFAGHFIYASWGCGTGCVQGAIIDTKTGIVYFPEELQGMGFGFSDEPIPDEPIRFRKDSKLFILHGRTADAGENAPNVNYLVWQGTKFERF